MDLSGLKWPAIIAAVVLVGWLGTGPGVNFMVTRATTAQVGADLNKDKADEAMLTRLGGYTLRTFQYEKAIEIMELSLSRYGESAPNYWYNLYRLVRCYEKLNNYQEAYNILQALVANSAQEKDQRVPNNDNLALRAEKLKEVHELK